MWDWFVLVLFHILQSNFSKGRKGSIYQTKFWIKMSPKISNEGVFLLTVPPKGKSSFWHSIQCHERRLLKESLCKKTNSCLIMFSSSTIYSWIVMQVWYIIYFPMYLYCLRFIINPISLLVFKTTVHQFNFTVMWLFNLTTQTKSERTIQVKAGFEITSPKVQVSKVQDCQFPDDQTSFVKVVDLQVSTRDVLFHGKD